mgnify:CR=1 FL=1
MRFIEYVSGYDITQSNSRQRQLPFREAVNYLFILFVYLANINVP